MRLLQGCHGNIERARWGRRCVRWRKEMRQGHVQGLPWRKGMRNLCDWTVCDDCVLICPNCEDPRVRVCSSHCLDEHLKTCRVCKDCNKDQTCQECMWDVCDECLVLCEICGEATVCKWCLKDHQRTCRKTVVIWKHTNKIEWIKLFLQWLTSKIHANLSVCWCLTTRNLSYCCWQTHPHLQCFVLAWHPDCKAESNRRHP